MPTYITNAFSLNMLPEGAAMNFSAVPCSAAHVRAAVVNGGSLAPGIVAAIGHADTAATVDGILGLEGGATTAGRVSVTVNVGDALYVAQYRGPRLPEGAKMGWMRVDVEGLE